MTSTRGSGRLDESAPRRCSICRLRALTRRRTTSPHPRYASQRRDRPGGIDHQVHRTEFALRHIVLMHLIGQSIQHGERKRHRQCRPPAPRPPVRYAPPQEGQHCIAEGVSAVLNPPVERRLRHTGQLRVGLCRQVEDQAHPDHDREPEPAIRAANATETAI